MGTFGVGDKADVATGGADFVGQVHGVGDIDSEIV